MGSIGTANKPIGSGDLNSGQYDSRDAAAAPETGAGQPKSNVRPGPIELLEDLETRSNPKNDSDMDNDDYDLGPDDARSVVGVSIGREQSRLLSPTTPAIEKTAAFDQYNQWGILDGASPIDQDVLPDSSTQEASVSEPRRDSSPGSSQDKPNTAQTEQVTLPSPWVSTASMKWALGKDQNREDDRSRTNSAGLLGDMNFKRFLPSLSFPFGNDSKTSREPKRLSGTLGKEDGAETQPRRTRASTLWASKSPWGNTARSRSPRKDRSPGPGRARASTNANTPLQSSTLRFAEPSTDESVLSAQTGDSQANSDTLRLTSSPEALSELSHIRTADAKSISELSRVSSLDNDSRWENIDAQINSRFKAIKDTLQDTLPEMPNIKLSALRPDFVLKRLSEPSPVGTNGTANANQDVSRGFQHESGLPIRQPSPPKTVNSRHLTLDEALEDLTGDIVILGGYRGSILRSAEPPHRQLWVPIKVGLNIRKVNMEVGLNDEDEETMEQRIFPSGMLQHIGPVDISRRLFKKLRSCRNAREGRLRVHDYGYDWRLSPHLLSRSLVDFLCGLECNRPGIPRKERGATVIAHSLGGVITRHAVNQRPELFAGVLYAGTPQHCVNILGPLRNGDEVLLSSKVLTAQTNFTMRSSFMLLPENGECFIDRDTKEPYPVNFFDVESWKRYAWSPCISTCLPSLPQPEGRRGILGSLHVLSPSNVGSSSNTPVPSPRPPAQGPTSPPSKPSPLHAAASHAASKAAEATPTTRNDALEMSMSPPPPAQSTASLPLPLALAYLERTLRRTLDFKMALAYDPDLQRENAYPPHAVLYATGIPTVYGARVAGRQGIARSDAYDNLAFASGDGVVLARASMLPEGYKYAKGGRVKTERGHVGMLGDLESVGRCLGAILRARKEGVGMGLGEDKDEKRKT